jgi:hypothetical protein
VIKAIVFLTDFSPTYAIYPYYHPLRPRFFNMATLFREVFAALYTGVQKYVENVRIIFFLNLFL